MDFEALDDEPAYIFFMIAAPEGAGNTHLRTLAALSRLLVDSDFIAELMNTNTPQEVSALFDAKQAEAAEKEAEKEKAKAAKEVQAASTVSGANNAKSNSGVIVGNANTEDFVVAVTACPTGIAHTYMAEDALKKKHRKWASTYVWRPTAPKARKTY